ncbi:MULTISPECIES: DUF3825 domain-containing protein [Actinosynnema]|uniref:DUF3825 domain-containing protein n=1 Tax=Actinosynnema TaxID=40566 RepID=UPI0020A4EEC9|nr:DUF3825 domain-containing protein [Actinosynnema pretiosum]MCP2098956.1 protein of unknown function (DUF3825) [Actinosynnema pretiosum]
MNDPQTATPSPADMARTRPATPTVSNTAPKRAPSALFDYAYMGYARSGEERRIGSGAKDYLDRLADLASPEDWDGADTNYPDEKRILRNYVERTFEQAKRQGRICISGDNGYSAFNTGLATSRQETIYGVFQRNNLPERQEWRFQGWQVESSRILLDTFSSLPDFVSYTNDPADYIFDWRRDLKVNTRHIVEDNITRFPADLQQEPFQLELTLNGAVDLARKRVRHNYKTAVPFWYPLQGQVQLLLPLSLRNPATVDLALVVSRLGEFYRGDTVLTTAMAYNNARLLARPDGDWLQPTASSDESLSAPTD